jgi:ADP-heptose:LPS heptosyltransferase
LVAELDVVIGIDSSVIHLSAALGQPTWVPLPPNPDWRWLLEREDSPWYPTMRLFRRNHTEGKGPQMGRIADAVRARLA